MALWAADSITGPYYAKLHGIKVKKRIVFRTTLRALACNLNTDPKDLKTLDKALSSMYADGTMKAIFAKNAKKFDIESKDLFF